MLPAHADAVLPAQPKRIAGGAPPPQRGSQNNHNQKWDTFDIDEAVMEMENEGKGEDDVEWTVSRYTYV